MHIDGPGPGLSCDHTTHSDEQLIECLARDWGVTVPQLVAMLAALVFSHTERTAGRDDRHDAPITLLPGVPGRTCSYCRRALPAGTHHSRRYCPGGECRRLAFNAWQRAGRPATRRETTR